MRYDIATLTVRLGKAGAVVAAIDAALKAPEAKGTLLGCWASEIGTLNQVILLRGFADEAELLSERQRLLASGNPFGAGEDIAKLAFDSYAPFPFLPPVQPGSMESTVFSMTENRPSIGLAGAL